MLAGPLAQPLTQDNAAYGTSARKMLTCKIEARFPIFPFSHFPIFPGSIFPRISPDACPSSLSQLMQTKICRDEYYIIGCLGALDRFINVFWTIFFLDKLCDSANEKVFFFNLF
jgi:hypothetical protein